jgi:hypothetical protein
MKRPECGTNIGYDRHLQNHEPACRSCKDANADRSRAWRRKVASADQHSVGNGSRDSLENIEAAITAGEWAKLTGYDPSTRTYV